VFHVKQNLKIYQELLHKWQKRINLVSNNTVKDSWERHFEDSLQLIDIIPNDINSIVDLGSGAGFPGLVIAIERPDINITLVESDQKKCSFLKTVSRETNTNVNVINDRIEKISLDFTPDIITARALASLDKLFDYCEKWVEQNPEITFIFPKGQSWKEELESCNKNWNFEYSEHKSKTDEFAVILVFTNISKIIK